VGTDSVNVYVPSVVAQSFYEVLRQEKTNQKDMLKESLRRNGRKGGREECGNFRETVKRKGFNMSREL